MEDSIKSNKLNLTLAAFEVPIASLFEFKDGRYVATLKSFRGLIDDFAFYGFFDVYIKIAKNGRVGRYTNSQTGYQDGVLGMLQNKEVDTLVIPVPIDIPDPPGWFAPVIREEPYYIYSIPSTTVGITQDLSKCLISFHLMMIWAAIIVTIFILEIAIVLPIHFKSTNNSNGIASLLIKTISRYCGILFGQYIPTVNQANNLIRLVQILLLTLSFTLFSATFNTSTIIGEDQGVINTLRDVVQQDKIPVFLEGLSVVELFQLGVSKDYREVYKQAIKKKSAQAYGLTSTDLLELLSPGYALLCSRQVGRSGSIVPAALGNVHAARMAQSRRPYHQSLLGFMANPLNHVNEIKRRISNLSMRVLQGGLLDKTFNKILDQFMMSITFVEIGPFDILKWELGYQVEHGTIFESLKLSGIQILFQVYLILILIAFIVHLIELTVKLSARFCLIVKQRKQQFNNNR